MPHEWRKKLDPAGLKLIERHAQLQSLGHPPLSDRKAFVSWLAQWKEIQASYPELVLRRRIHVSPEFIEFYCLADSDSADQFSRDELISLFAEEMWPASMAVGLEMAERLWSLFESDPKERARAYVTIGGWISIAGPLIDDMRERQFGKRLKNTDQALIAQAQVLESIALVLRGRGEFPHGRVNVELAGLVNAILKHQQLEMIQVELYDALKAARANLPTDFEAFRSWLHRARKSGLVTPSRKRTPGGTPAAADTE